MCIRDSAYTSRDRTVYNVSNVPLVREGLVDSLLLGVDFYRKAMDFQQKYADGKKIENILQTNGTLVDEAWCDLFASNNFLDVYKRQESGSGRSRPRCPAPAGWPARRRRR